MRELTDGATAIVRGALAAGCDFFAGYPITPASQILMLMMRDLSTVGGCLVSGSRDARIDSQPAHRARGGPGAARSLPSGRARRVGEALGQGL